MTVTIDQVERTARRLLELKPAADEYRRLENLLAGQLLTVDMESIDVPGLGRVGWDERGYWQVDAVPVLAVVEVTQIPLPGRTS